MMCCDIDMNFCFDVCVACVWYVRLLSTERTTVATLTNRLDVMMQNGHDIEKNTTTTTTTLATVGIIPNVLPPPTNGRPVQHV
jgi:hypothetical protein